ncbi:MAG: hypothetical protein Q9M32_01490 [Sulfurimonas sp.]|nr:hypothetical protein [Sulfurimonas sp.]MDQ7061730.1 hypothetical protein [Sulfurimonas sp.]
MKKILLGLIATLVFIGCSSEKEVTINVEPSLVVGKSLTAAKFFDQFEKPHSLSADTTKLIFVFSDDMGHLANDYFATKEASYLNDNNTQFVADISKAPSIIRSMFIMPGLKDFKHTVLVLTEKVDSAPFRAGVDTEKILVVTLDNMNITALKTISSQEELIAIIEAK